MTNENKFQVAPDVMAREVGEEVVLLHLASGTYFGLDPVGARIWALIGEGKTFAQICETMADEFDAPHARIEQDLQALTRQLTEQKLIFPQEG